MRDQTDPVMPPLMAPAPLPAPLPAADANRAAEQGREHAQDPAALAVPADSCDGVTADAPAQAGRLTHAQLLSQWSARAWAFDYFATMRRLESLAPELPRWGHALRPSAEAVRVAQEPSLSFAPASFSRFEPADDHRPVRLRQQFFRYIGPNGPLPMHLSDFIRERALNHSDPTWLAFLDTFLHRFALQFYRAWAQARPVTGMDRPGQDAFRHQVGALIGMGTPARQQRDGVHDDARLYFSGWLSRGVHSAEGVEAVVGAYFGVPARLERWVGHWMPLPPSELTRVGDSNANGPSRALGLGAVLGRRVWDRQHKVRLHLGPLTQAQYRRFLPIGDARPVLAQWMRQLLGDALDWDAELVLRHDEVPPTRLGQRGAESEGHQPRLGWTSWLGQCPRTRDARDVRITGAHAGRSSWTPKSAGQDLQNMQDGSSMTRSHP